MSKLIPLSPNARAWRDYFAANDWPELPAARPLTSHECELIAGSLPQFQLGEGAQGRSFRQRAAAFGERQGDPDFLPAIAAFIAEEQRHSEQLGLFLDQAGIRKLSQDSVDGLFRWVRKLAGLRLMVAVLVAAESIAIPYYRAVRAATGCERLRSICALILRDESAHLRFQGFTLRRLGHHAGWIWLHRFAVLVAALTVFCQHGRLIRASGYRLGPWLADAFHALAIVESAARPRRRRPTLSGLVELAG